MNRRGTRLAAVTALVAISTAASSAGGAEVPPTLAYCAGIAAAPTRLACYDALAGRAADRTGAAAASTNASAASPAASPAAPTAPPVSAPAPGAAVAPANDPRNFGLTQVPVRTAAKETTTIQAHVENIIANRVGRAYVVLDNGQTWVFVDPDDDARLSPGDTVTRGEESLLGLPVHDADSRRSDLLTTYA